MMDEDRGTGGAAAGESYDASDLRHVRDRRKRQRLLDRRADMAFAQLMASADGRLWVWRKLAACGVFHSSWDAHGGRMSFNEGRRDIGLHLLGDINRLCPELYGQMQKENADND
jgi:hypothetical protein